MNHHITEKRARDIVGINYIVVISVPINYREKKHQRWSLFRKGLNVL